LKAGTPALQVAGLCQAAVIHEWIEADHKVQGYAGGKCAVVTYFFPITFAMGTAKQTMQGRAMFFLVKESRKWLVDADQVSREPLPTQARSDHRMLAVFCRIKIVSGPIVLERFHGH
jgi:hypothetical protein